MTTGMSILMKLVAKYLICTMKIKTRINKEKNKLKKLNKLINKIDKWINKQYILCSRSSSVP